MTIAEAKQELIDLAQSQVGYREGPNNYNKYADDPKVIQLYGWCPQNQPWCCTFVNWCYLNAFGYDFGSRLTYGGTAACDNSATLFKNHGAFVHAPEVGDQAFYFVGGKINHTGTVVAVAGSSFTTIEGNYSDKVSEVHRNLGDADVAGFGRPCWAIVEGASEQEPEAPKQDAILYKGMMKNASVKAMQAMLMDLGYDLGKWKDDGDYGNDTFRAVAEFQEDHGLPVTGSVNQKTLDAIKAAWKGKEQPPDDPPPEDDTEHQLILSELSYGSRGDQAVFLQAALNLRGFPCGKADGEIGPKTLAALNAFKEYKGLKPDSKADQDTWTLLLMWQW